MSAARDQADCRRFERWLTAYIDDELDAVHILDVEGHLDICEWCLEQVELARATRCSLRRMVQMRAPSALRSRICSQLRSDLARSSADVESTSSGGEPPRPELIKARYAVPLALAAMFALVFGALQLKSGNSQARSGGVASAGIPVTPALLHPASLHPASFETFLEELVAQHAKAPPFEVTNIEETQRFEPLLGFNTKPPRFSGANFDGMRLHSQRAAMLGYHTKDKRRFTLYMFDAKRLPIVTKRLRAEHFGARRVYVGRMRGYTVAARDSDGLGMAIASDLDEKRTTALLVASQQY